MKILFINHLPNPNPNAAWVRISFFANYLKDLGHHVNIAGNFSLKSLDKAGYIYWNEIKIINITPTVMATNMISFFFNIISSFITSIPLIGILNSDIIVISVPPGEGAFGSFIVAKLMKKKIVIDYRDEWEDHLIRISTSIIYKKTYSLFKKLMSVCYRTCNLMITVNGSISKSLLLRNIQNVKIITNGADCNIFRPLDKDIDKDKIRRSIGFNKNDFILVFSGNFTQYYRIDVVIKALKKIILINPNIKLLIIGHGSEMDVKEIIDLSKALGVYNNVNILDAKTDRIEIANLISCCNVGIVPFDSSKRVKYSIPVKSFEYFACGLPVLATTFKDSMLGKLIEENDIGLISNPENINDLANTLEKIYYYDTVSAGKRAVSLVKKNYDRNTIAKEFLNLLETVFES